MAQIFGTDYVALNEELRADREAGKRIVMCSGTFDLFHIGHMRMLAAAKKKGDVLIVCVKSDRGASLKKEDPPVMNQDYRMETISNCISADYVIMADYDTSRVVPFQFKNTSSFEWLNMFMPIIRCIRPDCFVHEDNPAIADAREQLFKRYKVEGIIQPRTEGISTTELIDKIKTRLLIKMQKDNKIIKKE